MKVLFIDTETGSTNTTKAGLIQLSGIIRIEKKDVETFNFLVKPFRGAEVTKAALEIQNRNFEELEKDIYENEEEVYQKLIKIFDKYIDKYNKADKFVVAGYNVKFDIEILKAFFERNNNKYLFSYLDSSMLDPLYSIRLLQVAGILPILENNKLETWCKYFDIELKAHDSFEDIKATKQLIFKLIELIRK